MHSINCNFKLNDKVILKEINRPGVVNGIIIDNQGIQYRVIYWNDCRRSSEWVYDWEIKLSHYE